MGDESSFSGTGYQVAGVPVIPRGRAAYRSGAESTSLPARHLVGYEPFLTLCLASRVNPSEFASSVTQFGGIARRERDAIRSDELADAAAVFLGNVLVALRDDASWIRYGDEFPSAGTEQHQWEILHLLDLLVDSGDATYRKCLDMIEGWARS